MHAAPLLLLLLATGLAATAALAPPAPNATAGARRALQQAGYKPNFKPAGRGTEISSSFVFVEVSEIHDQCAEMARRAAQEGGRRVQLVPLVHWKGGEERVSLPASQLRRRPGRACQRRPPCIMLPDSRAGWPSLTSRPTPAGRRLVLQALRHLLRPKRGRDPQLQGRGQELHAACLQRRLPLHLRAAACGPQRWAGLPRGRQRAAAAACLPPGPPAAAARNARSNPHLRLDTASLPTRMLR
jgi:hypothetical protein